MGLFDLFKPIWMRYENEYGLKGSKFEKKAIRAVEKITDQSLLASIARKSPHLNVCIKAAEKLTDQSVLADIAKDHKYDDVCATAAEKLTDQKLLVKVAYHASHKSAVSKAASKINDYDVLGYVYEKYRNDEYFSPADCARCRLKELIDKVTDHSVLSKITKNSRYDIICEIANNKLHSICIDKGDQSTIADIALHGTNKELRYKAIKKLTDQSVLADIAKNDSDYYVRREALKHITNPAFLHLKCDADMHEWTSYAICKKKCTICGICWYDHDYQQKSSNVSGISGDERVNESYQCCNCGHLAYVTSGYWNDSDTRELGIIEKLK